MPKAERTITKQQFWHTCAVAVPWLQLSTAVSVESVPPARLKIFRSQDGLLQKALWAERSSPLGHLSICLCGIYAAECWKSPVWKFPLSQLPSLSYWTMWGGKAEKEACYRSLITQSIRKTFKILSWRLCNLRGKWRHLSISSCTRKGMGIVCYASIRGISMVWLVWTPALGIMRRGVLHHWTEGMVRATRSWSHHFMFGQLWLPQFLLLRGTPFKWCSFKVFKWEPLQENGGGSHQCFLLQENLEVMLWHHFWVLLEEEEALVAVTSWSGCHSILSPLKATPWKVCTFKWQNRGQQPEH